MCYKCEATVKNPLPYCFHDSSNPGELVECSSGFDTCYSILTRKKFNFHFHKINTYMYIFMPLQKKMYIFLSSLPKFLL